MTKTSYVFQPYGIDPFHVDLKVIREPKGKNTYGRIHTHAKYKIPSDNDFGHNDIKLAKEYRQISYLVNPIGHLKKFDYWRWYKTCTGYGNCGDINKFITTIRKNIPTK